MLTGAVIWMHGNGPWLFLMGFVAVIFSACSAGGATRSAENDAGDHTPVVKIGLRYGFIMFIMSEVMFFVAWFWAFFKHQIYPMNEYDYTVFVTPADIYMIDPFHLPLINTVILLLSGCAVTWAHHALVHEDNRKDVENGLLIGIILGVALHRTAGLRVLTS